MSEAKSEYIKQVKSLFRLNKDAGPGGRTASVHPKSAPETTDPKPVEPVLAQQQQKGDGENFDTRLKEFVSVRDTRDGLVAGRVHMLNTDTVRERLGDRWPGFADRIHDIIAAELKARLGPRDLFTKVHGGSYVIVFGDCSEIEARLKVAMLSEKILEKLLGEAEAKDIQALGVKRLVTRSDGTVAAEALENMDTLVAMLDKSEETGARAETYDYKDIAAGRRALTPEEVAHLMSAVDGELEEVERHTAASGTPAVRIDRLQGTLRQLGSLEDAMRAKVPAFAPNEDRKKAGAYAPGIKYTKPILDRIEETKKRAERQIVFLYDRDPTDAGTDNTEVSLKVEFAYHPMWHAPSNRIGVYVCHAFLRDGDGTSLKLKEIDKDHEADVLAIVDRLALRKVRDDLDKAAANGVLNVMMVPVHFSTLQRHGSRMRFLEICSRVPDTQAKALSWEIMGSHVESWSLQLKAAIKQIAPFGRAIFLRLPNLEENFSGIRHNLSYLREAGIQAVGVDVAALRGTEAQKLHLLEHLAELAEKSGLKCYGRGFHSLSMTICAACMGYQHISGLAIAAPTERPEGIRATEMENIYGRVLFQEPAGERCQSKLP